MYTDAGFDMSIGSQGLEIRVDTQFVSEIKAHRHINEQKRKKHKTLDETRPRLQWHHFKIAKLKGQGWLYFNLQ